MSAREDDSVPWREVEAFAHTLRFGDLAMVVCASRERARLSRAQLAQHLGVTPNYILEIETGKRRQVSKCIARKMSKLFNVGTALFEA